VKNRLVDNEPVMKSSSIVRPLIPIVGLALTLIDAVAQAPPPARAANADWPTYNGHMSGNRFSPLDQINTSTVERLAPKWMFTIQNTPRALQVTPLVIDGVMYVTSVNEAFALDARVGRRRRQRNQSRRGGARQSPLHGHRQRAPHRAQPRQG
jgi:glucose dehydrogenase